MAARTTIDDAEVHPSLPRPYVRLLQDASAATNFQGKTGLCGYPRYEHVPRRRAICFDSFCSFATRTGFMFFALTHVLAISQYLQAVPQDLAANIRQVLVHPTIFFCAEVLDIPIVQAELSRLQCYKATPIDLLRSGMLSA